MIAYLPRVEPGRLKKKTMIAYLPRVEPHRKTRVPTRQQQNIEFFSVCLNKVPQPKWLKTIKIYFLPFWSLKSEIKVSAGPCSQEVLREDLFLPLASSSSPSVS